MATTAERYSTVIVWMRRALRTEDNLALWAATKDADRIVPIVCLREGPEYDSSTPRREFLRGSLAALDSRLRELGSRLMVRTGDPAREIPAAAAEFDANAVYAIRVYDPKTVRRDRRIEAELSRHRRRFVTFKDAVLVEGHELLSSGGSPFKIFTPYKKAWLERAGDIPRPLPKIRPFVTPPPGPGTRELRDFFPQITPAERAGERAARGQLEVFVKQGLFSYKQQRDLPGTDGTSRLSPHLATGSISIRTVFARVQDVRANAPAAARESIDIFISEIVWREFYYSILANFPHVVDGAFKPQFNDLAWSRNRAHLEAWKSGRTGYPIVDAGMRQLNSEGWMHNRARMIVASFLTKDLHIDWKVGERHFMERLIDADIASNNGGWQWTAGTGTDASPWFRIFNPVLQGEKFDPDGTYVRRYVPELASIPGRWIHRPWELSRDERERAGIVPGRTYPEPVIDHDAERKVTLELYRNPGKRGRSRPARRT